MNFEGMPLDPFADDPNDPASFLEPEDDFPPLTIDERAHVLEDLTLLEKFQAALEPRGVLGIFFFCEDCAEPHYYNWEIMKDNMRSILSGQQSPVHEPSANPDVQAYVPWDYCLGYLDGLEAR
ncbi:DUF5319 domain-containing protein [Corynebacterium hindlerae]|uniref:DUF5319 domain-containing protein n=1 Tax=Corynebacterium hindlerae TaxID=699041 RepID=A0A7G5FHH6_9CORY|nr:DUF5319 domain-containing protein [Corynebacterium hindlerae]QMV86067.1 DUF5319 domain-containing protein [Corynebacterium hindlerae]